MKGGRGMESIWMSIINSQKAAKWANLVTWNDMGEDSHWSPHPNPSRNPSNGPVWSHSGHAELNKYYIQWWKTGQPPAIEKDKLFYFYRNQFHDAQALNGMFEPTMHVADLIYVTAMLTIHSGSKTTVYDVTCRHSSLGSGHGRGNPTSYRDP